MEYRHLDPQKAEQAARQLSLQIQSWLEAETASGGCGNITIHIISTVTNAVFADPVLYTVTRTWEAVDDCDCANAARCIVTMTA